MVHFVVNAVKYIFLIKEFREAMHNTIIFLQFDLESLMYKLVQVIFNLLLSISKVVLVLLELHFDIIGYRIKFIREFVPLRFLEEIFSYAIFKLSQWVVVSFNC